MYNNMPSSHQSGIALIVVLLFLILIAIAGAIALRQSSVDLNVATNDQAGTLLLNSSDSLLAHIESVGSNPKHPQYAKIMTERRGILGYFLVQTQSKYGHQISLCYQPNQSTLYEQNRAYIRQLGNSFLATDKACHPKKSSDYSSARNTAMTQLVVQGLEDNVSDNFAAAARGTSEGGSSNQINPKIQINSVSIIPALANASYQEINNCLARPVGNASNYGISNGNINDCLRNNNIPNTSLVEEGTLQKVETGGFDSGTGAIIDICANDPTCQQALGTP